ncbi:Uncharacterised protein [Candidatus Venteria ishoeyi]|uniref:Uncharacterized protein n=1 Tax=Candidatus Venteria ishoeyi TaxID=1899563 RepID=A0A1H6FFP0_9GAMM|nr:Uncharacterised protein [Candidatus Venteria ishoeyi]
MQDTEVKKVSERHYELVLSSDITDEELSQYNQLS